MNVAIRHILRNTTFRLCAKKHKISDNFFTTTIIQRRYYSNDRSGTPRIPQLMESPQFLPIPFPFDWIKNRVLEYFIIRPSADQEFKLYEFVEASKHAVQIVSEHLQNNDFEGLNGLVANDAIATLKESVSKLSDSQRNELAINKEDIFSASVSDANVISENTERLWVEITMCYIVIRDLKKLGPMVEANVLRSLFSNDGKDKLKTFLLNYRFRREYTKGVEDSWIINLVNHYG